MIQIKIDDLVELISNFIALSRAKYGDRINVISPKKNIEIYIIRRDGLKLYCYDNQNTDLFGDVLNYVLQKWVI